MPILVSLTQFFIRTLARVLMLFLSKVEVKGKDNAEKTSRPLLIIANHKSYYDPLVIAVSLSVFSKVYPLRFIAKDQLFKGFLSRITFYLMGSFPTYYGNGLDKSLEIPVAILREKGTVVFFPEGKCIREEALGEGRMGAATLALKVPEAQILPMAISGSYKIGRIFNRPKVKTRIGEPFYLKDRINITGSTTAEEVTDLFMREIGKLYEPLAEKKLEKSRVYQT